MEENKTKKEKRFEPLDLIKGYFMGVAFIIPGFSGGSIAAILGIYERLVGAIADLFKSFKKSFFTLLPIFLGLCAGAVSLMYPLKWALGSFAFPTVALFVGLALGGLPSITRECKGRITLPTSLSFIISFAAALTLSFIPITEDKDLSSPTLVGCILLFAVGMLASSALVVPGISGSMILLILGYYNPILSVLTDKLLKGENVGEALIVLASAGLGIATGFILISIVMKRLLIKARRETFFAILGFVIGSIPTVFVSTAKDGGYTLRTLPTSVLYWALTALLLILGIALSLTLVFKARKRENATD